MSSRSEVNDFGYMINNQKLGAYLNFEEIKEIRREAEDGGFY